MTVGVELERPSGLVLEAALREASRRGARLRVVHAWQPDRSSGTYGERASVGDRLEELVHAAGSAAGTAVDVAVEVVVEPGPAGAVLREQSSGCDLLVVGRHHRRHLVGAPLGPVSREVLRWSAVPVLVIDALRGDVGGAEVADGGSAAIGS